MDWPKAKTILIIAFLITDLFLIFSYVLPKYITQEHTDNQTFIDVLARKNIYIETEIPQKHSNMPVLYVKHEICDEEKINGLLDAQKPLPDDTDTDEMYQKAAETFIKNTGLMYDTLLFNKVERAGGNIIVSFKNQVNDILVEKSDLACTFRDRLLIGFECNWLYVTEFNDKKQSTISAVEALLMFMDEIAFDNTDKKITIEELKMVYWLEESSIDVNAVTDTAIPAWKIVYNGGETKYINAYEQ